MKENTWKNYLSRRNEEESEKWKEISTQVKKEVINAKRQKWKCFGRFMEDRANTILSQDLKKYEKGVKTHSTTSKR